MEGTPQYSLNMMLCGTRTDVDVFEKSCLYPPRHQTKDCSACFEILIWYVPEESDESHRTLGLGLLIEIWTQGLLNTKEVSVTFINHLMHSIITVIYVKILSALDG